MSTHAVPTQPARRWSIYLAERFPLTRHGVVVAAFVFGTLCYASALEAARVTVAAFVSAYLIALLFFLELRVADEFKDAADDARYRPYRPVPRGLVTLRELARIAAVAVAVQIVAAALAGPAALAATTVALGYLALMCREFFVRRWLRAHPVVYIASHGIIVPLIAIAVAACIGIPPAPAKLAWFLALAYATSTVFEVGRKIRAPADEREGVETYTALWGTSRALDAWIAILAASAVLAAVAVARLDSRLVFVASMFGTAFVLWAAVVAERFALALRPGSGTIFGTIAGAWLVAVYVAIGVAALAAGRG